MQILLTWNCPGSHNELAGIPALKVEGFSLQINVRFIL